MTTLDKKYAWNFEGISDEDFEKINKQNKTGLHDEAWCRDYVNDIIYFCEVCDDWLWHTGGQETEKEIRMVKDLLTNTN